MSYHDIYRHRAAKALGIPTPGSGRRYTPDQLEALKLYEALRVSLPDSLKKGNPHIIASCVELLLDYPDALGLAVDRKRSIWVICEDNPELLLVVLKTRYVDDDATGCWYIPHPFKINPPINPEEGKRT
jgi:hypothetical protein